MQGGVANLPGPPGGGCARPTQTVTIGDRQVTIDVDWTIGTNIIPAEINSKPVTLQYLESTPMGFRLVHYGTTFDVTVLTPRQFELSKHIKERPKLDVSKVITSPMPGSVVSVAVKPGDKVVEGQEVAVVEAMKMQNVLRAQRFGTVKAVNVQAGSSVSADEVLIEFADEPAKA